MSNTKNKRDAVEKIVFWLSVAMVTVLLGYMSYRMITHETEPPKIEVTYNLEPTDREPNRYRITVQNRGSKTAEDVRVKLSLHAKGSDAETGELDVKFCPKNSRRYGFVTFNTPRRPDDSVAMRVLSYNVP